jgi:hypothetical protein
MKNIIAVLIAAVLFSSCAVVNHLEEVSMLQEFSQEQNALNAMVEERDGDFDALLARIASGDKLADLNNRQALLKRLGEPVLVLPSSDGNLKRERWLYRHQTNSPKSAKVYFVLDENGAVLSWSKEDAPGATDPSSHAAQPR